MTFLIEDSDALEKGEGDASCMGASDGDNYRGIVTNNNDPMSAFRIRARVPDVFGDSESAWAMPCAPFGIFALPPVGAGVWIGFERGDRGSPIWTGTWWGAGELPALFLGPADQKVGMQTEGGHTVILDDSVETGGITLRTSGGQMLVLSSIGIEIEDGFGARVKLIGL